MKNPAGFFILGSIAVVEQLQYAVVPRFNFDSNISVGRDFFSAYHIGNLQIAGITLNLEIVKGKSDTFRFIAAVQGDDHRLFGIADNIDVVSLSFRHNRYCVGGKRNAQSEDLN